MDWQLLALIGIGFTAGFINTLAGGGSLISLPFLMFLGLPANVANGTLRIAILMQNLVGVSSFKQQKVFNFREGIWYSLPAALGAIIGASFAISINDEIMKYIIGTLLVFMFFFMILKPNVWLKQKSELIKTKPSIIQIIVLFFIGLYGGFIQAGVGFFLLAGLVLSAGFDLVKANAIKIFIVLIYTFFALSVFIFDGLVNYKFGLILAAGNMVGAFIGSRFAVSWGPKFVRYILLVVLLFNALKIFGVFDLLF